MKKFIMLYMILFLVLAGCSLTPVSVIDGDTIDLGGSRIRYLGIDTPEIGEPYYIEAKNCNIELLGNKLISLEEDLTDKDIYGRLLRYVYAGEVFVNCELVNRGYALVYKKEKFQDIKYYDIFKDALDKAAGTRIGIWSMTELHPKLKNTSNYYIPTSFSVN